MRSTMHVMSRNMMVIMIIIAYMAPESRVPLQMPVPQWDIYAFGVLMWEVLPAIPYRHNTCHFVRVVW